MRVGGAWDLQEPQSFHLCDGAIVKIIGGNVAESTCQLLSKRQMWALVEGLVLFHVLVLNLEML